MKGLVSYMDFQALKTALLTVTNNVYHYEALEATAPYIVWAEDNEVNQLSADNSKCYQVVQGTIDYYTLTDNDPNVNAIQNALAAADISFTLNSVQYEDETTLIHYEWLFEVVAWQNLQ